MEKNNYPSIEAVVDEMKKRGYDVGCGQILEPDGESTGMSFTVFKDGLHLVTYCLPDGLLSGKDASGAADYMENLIKNDPCMNDLRKIHRLYKKAYHEPDCRILDRICLKLAKDADSATLYRKSPVDGLFEVITVRLEGDRSTGLFKVETEDWGLDSETLFAVARVNSVMDAMIEPTELADDIYLLQGAPSALFAAGKLGEYFLPMGIKRIKVYPVSNTGGFIIACGDKSTFSSEVKVRDTIDKLSFGMVLCSDSYIIDLDEVRR